MNSPHLLLTNFHSKQNAGDAALLQVSLEKLRLEFPLSRLTLLANHPNEAGLARLGVEVLPSPAALCGSFDGTQPLHQVGRLIRGWLHPTGTWLKLRQVVTEVDAVISCPGNPFFSMGRVGWPLLLSSLPLAMAGMKKKPILVLPQTLGPLSRLWEKIWMRSILHRASWVFLREPDSQKQAAALGVPVERLSTHADPCFLLKPAGETEAAAILSRHGWQPGQAALGVSLVPQMVRTLSAADLERAYASFASALGSFTAQQQVRLYFFAQSHGPTPREDDRLPARRVMAALADGCAAVLVDEPLSPAQLKACYARMDAMVCMRLHAGLFSMGAATPALLVGYLPKTAAVLNSLGWQQWGIPLADCTHDVLAEKLNDLWRQRAELRAWLEKLIPAREHSAGEPFHMLAGLLRAEGR